MKVVWMITCWRIWSKRNVILFNDDIGDGGDIEFNIKLVSWLWTIDSKKKQRCKFYDLHKFPLEAIK